MPSQHYENKHTLIHFYIAPLTPLNLHRSIHLCLIPCNRTVIRSRSLCNRSRRRRRPRHIIRARLRHRRLRRSTRNKARTRRGDFLRAAQTKGDVNTARKRELDANLALADGEFGGARHVVKGVGRHGVVVCVVGAGGARLVWGRTVYERWEDLRRDGGIRTR
jgi:hypothetical protein